MSTMSLNEAPMVPGARAAERGGALEELATRSPPWSARVGAMLRQVDTLLDALVAESAQTAGPDAAWWLDRLERARVELMRLGASEATVAAEREAALALLAHEAPALYAALATAAVAMTSTTMAESTLMRAPGWGLARPVIGGARTGPRRGHVPTRSRRAR